jgi:hypothetical protein
MNDDDYSIGTETTTASTRLALAKAQAQILRLTKAGVPHNDMDEDTVSSAANTRDSQRNEDTSSYDTTKKTTPSTQHALAVAHTQLAQFQANTKPGNIISPDKAPVRPRPTDTVTGGGGGKI